MERLTDKDTNKVCFDTWELCGLDSVCKRDCHKPTPCKIPKIVRRLAELEDKLESGQLVELTGKPLTIEELKALKVDDWVWFVRNCTDLNTGDEYEESEYRRIYAIEEKRILFAAGYMQNIAHFNKHGRDWVAYKNKEQAESSLKELQEK